MSIERVAVTLDDTDHAARALELLDAALAKDPTSIECNYNKSLWLLSSGRFVEGWPQWEWRLKLKTAKAGYDWFPVPQWKLGDDLAGKHVFVWMEQGVGDQILTSSMIPDLCAVAGSVTIHCYARLVPLFRRSFPKAIICKLGEPKPERMKTWAFDYQMSVSDLGLAFRKTFEDFPKHNGFLKADPKLVAEIRKRYGASDDFLLTGLSWRSTNYMIGGGKSMKLANIGHILTASNVKFVNLQYGDVADEIAEAKQRFGVDIINDPEIDQLINMDDFAAQVAAMDQVISTSNTCLHLAGALGVPTNGFIPRGASRIWYWFAERTDSPWYPSVELMRQRAPGAPSNSRLALNIPISEHRFGNLPFEKGYSPEGTMNMPSRDAQAEFCNV